MNRRETKLKRGYTVLVEKDHNGYQVSIYSGLHKLKTRKFRRERDAKLYKDTLKEMYG